MYICLYADTVISIMGIIVFIQNWPVTVFKKNQKLSSP